MSNHSIGKKIVIGLTAGLLTGGLYVARAHADESTMQRTSPTSASRMMSETFVVSGIDRGKRTVTLTNAEGERNTMSVPSDVKAYETLKVGDRVDVDYQESLAIKLAPTGAKPSKTETTVASPMGQGGPAGAARQTQLNAEVVSVDAAKNKVTFKGPRGQEQTVTVQDPQLQAKLHNLKPGQVVQFTYTEAIAAGIRPAPAK
jgi:ribosomal protein L3